MLANLCCLIVPGPAAASSPSRTGPFWLTALSPLSAAAGLSGLIAFVAAVSAWGGTRPSLAVIVAVCLGAAALWTAVWTLALRAAGRRWGQALTADLLTYAPLALYWAPALWWNEEPDFPFAMLSLLPFAAPPTVVAAKIALLATLWRGGAVALAGSRPAELVGDIARYLSRLGRLLAPLALAGVAVRYQMSVHSSLFHARFEPEHELLAHAGEAILLGKVPYRDLASVFGPAMLYAHAGALGGLGTTLAAANWVAIAGGVLLPLAAYYAGRLVMPAGMAFLAALLVAAVGESSLALSFALWGVVVGLSEAGSRWGSWFWSGLLVGLAGLFDPQPAVAAAAALALMLYLRQRNFVMRRVGAYGADLALGTWALAPFALGVAAVWAPVLAYFALLGALPAAMSDLGDGMSGRVFSILRAPPVWTALWLPVGAYVVVLGLVMRRAAARRLGEREFAAFTVAGMGAAWLAWAWARGDWYHVRGSEAMAMLAAMFAAGWAAKALGQALVGWPQGDHLRAVRASAAALVVMAIALPWGAKGAQGAMEALGRPPSAAMYDERGDWVALDLPRAGGVRMPPDDARLLEAVVLYVQEITAPGEAIFCVPGRPALYLLAERPNATRLAYAYQGHVRVGDAAQAVADLVADKTRVVVAAPSGFWPRAPDTDPTIDAYLGRQYEELKRFDGFVVLLRKGASPEAAPPAPPPAPHPVAPPPSLFDPRELEGDL